MQAVVSSQLPTARVVALYSADAVSFDLSNGSTFADLADRLSDFGDWRAGSPTAITLRFALPRPSDISDRTDASSPA
jgi:hypothetical protein